MSRWLNPGLLLLAGLLPVSELASSQTHLLAALDGAYRQIPKQVTLVVEERRVVASNVRLSRIDVLPLGDGEYVEETAEADAVLIVVTDKRLLGYGSVTGWRETPRQVNESLESIAVEDFAAFVTTASRYLNFNADTGIWAEQARTRP